MMRRNPMVLLMTFAALLAAPMWLAAQAPATTARIVTHDNRAAAGVLRSGVLELQLEAAAGMWYPEAEDGPGETADFEVSFATPGIWRLEVKTQLSGWHIPVTVRVR
jgi:hypothetical protein